LHRSHHRCARRVDVRGLDERRGDLVDRAVRKVGDDATQELCETPLDGREVPTAARARIDGAALAMATKNSTHRRSADVEENRDLSIRLALSFRADDGLAEANIQRQTVHSHFYD
jgi:hypothetical protein